MAGTFNFMDFRSYDLWNKSNHLETSVMNAIFVLSTYNVNIYFQI